MKSNFAYTLDNKRYHTYNYYLKSTYKNKVAKIAIDANFTCPNRDGLKSTGGCIFCNGVGSSDFSSTYTGDLIKQYNDYKETYIDPKWPNAYTIPYFQAFSNTYGPLEKIQKMIEPFLNLEEVKEISLATRADCLTKEIVDYLNSLTSKLEIWLEIGIQSSNEESLKFMNKGESFKEIKENLKLLDNTNIKVCLHIINGMPNESEEDMLKTIDDINTLRYHAVKFHMLEILKGTKLAMIYEAKPFHVLTRDEYLNILIKQLEKIPADKIIERINGDAQKDELIEPKWITNKTDFRNQLDLKMVELDTYQGKNYEC